MESKLLFDKKKRYGQIAFDMPIADIMDLARLVLPPGTLCKILKYRSRVDQGVQCAWYYDPYGTIPNSDVVSVFGEFVA